MAHIVVGVDRSAGAGFALRWAVEEAARTGALLSTVHAWQLPVSARVPLSPATISALQSSFDPAASMPVTDLPETTAWAVEGDPGPVLVERAEHADLLVVGGRQDGPFFRGTNTRVASYCLHHAAAPVAVVPCHEPAQRVTGQGRSVVVGVDSSVASHRALRWAASAARQRDATLVAVHAWQVASASPAEVLHPSPDLRAPGDRARERLRCWIDETLGDEPGIPVELTVHRGSPLDHLLEHAATADLVVLGAAGHQALRRRVMGSLNEQLAPLCPCPVVVVPPTPSLAGTSA